MTDPIRPRSAQKIADGLARHIATDIVRRQLPAGHRLASENEMLDEFGVGRASLREALRILESQGVVTLRRGPGGGAMVAEYGSRDFARMATLHLQLRRATYQELIEARTSVEPVVARLAAERWDRLDALDEVRSRAKALTDDGAALLAAFADFHHVVEQLGRNTVMELFAAGMREVSRVQSSSWDPLYDHLVSTEGRRQNLREHDAIARAIERRDGRRAERLMRSHLAALLVGTSYHQQKLSEPITWD